MKNIWNTKIYMQFLHSRTRPAQDLLSVFPDSFHPKIVYDLGCGPGNSTVLLKNRWPHSKIVGIDSSCDMLQEAKSSYPEINFIEEDIADFSLQEKVDCLFANASLQWLDKHEVLIPRLLGFINTGGIFGIQMPNNYHSPSHQVIIKILQSNPAWQPLLKFLRYERLIAPFYKLSWYYDLLIKSGVESLQLWETEYFQEMSNYQEIFDWVSGTGLRPVLSTMNDDNQTQFAKEYINAVTIEYPLQANNKILMPFRRIFMVIYK